MSSVQTYLDQEPDSGGLVYPKKEKKYDITEPIVDIDELGKRVWDVKRSVFAGELYSIENQEKCSNCQY
ncbi:MAG: hypothetical protein ACTSP3_00120 [Candidatus Heimdallarchaeaceae archaeon]